VSRPRHREAVGRWVSACVLGREKCLRAGLASEETQRVVQRAAPSHRREQFGELVSGVVHCGWCRSDVRAVKWKQLGTVWRGTTREGRNMLMRRGTDVVLLLLD
jgi:hypothetical protein